MKNVRSKPAVVPNGTAAPRAALPPRGPERAQQVVQRSTPAPAARPASTGRTNVIQRKLTWELSGGYTMAFLVMAEAVKISPQARELWQLCEGAGVNLIFRMSNRLGHNVIAGTSIAGQQMIGHKDLFKTAENLKLIDRSGPITILIELNENWEHVNSIAKCAETLAHEYVLHAVPLLPLIKLLKDKNRYRIEQIVQYWNEALSGYESGHHTHHRLGQKTHEDMNQVIEKMHGMFVKYGQPDIATELAEEYEVDAYTHAVKYPQPRAPKLKPTHLPVSYIL